MVIDVQALLFLVSLPLLLIAVALIRWGMLGLQVLPSATSMSGMNEPKGSLPGCESGVTLTFSF